MVTIQVKCTANESTGGGYHTVTFDASHHVPQTDPQVASDLTTRFSLPMTEAAAASYIVGSIYPWSG